MGHNDAKGEGPNGTICTAGCGINSGQSQYLVTVKDGAGSFEVYPADCINYFLFGEIMSDVYFSYRYIQASYSKGDPCWKDADPDVEDFFTDEAASINDFGLQNTLDSVNAYRSLSSLLDKGGVAAAVAFAKAGWTGDWNAINGLGITGAIPCTTPYQGYLAWRVGTTLFSRTPASRRKPGSTSKVTRLLTLRKAACGRIIIPANFAAASRGTQREWHRVCDRCRPVKWRGQLPGCRNARRNVPI